MTHIVYACVCMYICVSCNVSLPTHLTNKHPNATTTGPILPVLGVGSVEEALGIIRRKPNPLALYVFAHDKYARTMMMRGIGDGRGYYA